MLSRERRESVKIPQKFITIHTAGFLYGEKSLARSFPLQRSRIGMQQNELGFPDLASFSNVDVHQRLKG